MTNVSLIPVMIFLSFWSCDHKDIGYAIANRTGEEIYVSTYYTEVSVDSITFEAGDVFTISGGANLDSDSAIFWTKESKIEKVYRHPRHENISGENHYYEPDNWRTDDGYRYYYYVTQESLLE